jgi:hypothetical protein
MAAVMVSRKAEQDRGLPAEIDWPMAMGYYAGLGLALAFEMMEPPLALFIAAIPILNMLNRPRASWPTCLLSQLLHGMAGPVGGHTDSAIQLSTPDVPLERRLTIWQEARAVADRARARR